MSDINHSWPVPLAERTWGGWAAAAVAATAGIFMDGVLFRLSETRFWYVQPDGALEAWLIAHSQGFDITVSDPRSWVLQVQGPSSPKIVADLSDGAIDDGLGYFHAGFFDLGGQEVYVSRTGWTGERGYEIYSLGAKTDHGRLWEHVMACGRPHGMIFDSIKSMEMRRIEAGILDNLTDFDRSMTPFAAGLGPFIDLDKEGFVGREALRTADRRVRLLGIKCGEDVPLYRGGIHAGARRVGHISAVTWSPTLDCGIGYARFDEAGDWIGKTLSVESEAGGEIPCDVVELPFFDKEKAIPRGIDTSVP